LFNELHWAFDRAAAFQARSQQRLSETQGPPALRFCVSDSSLPKLHLEMRQSAAKGVEGSAVVESRIQIVGFVVTHDDVAGLPKSREDRVGKTPVKMARQRDLPGLAFPSSDSVIE
jgi:hypothetical protein